MSENYILRELFKVCYLLVNFIAHNGPSEDIQDQNWQARERIEELKEILVQLGEEIDEMESSHTEPER